MPDTHRDTSAGEVRTPGRRIELPRWKVKLLAVALVVAGIGGAVQLSSSLRDRSAAAPADATATTTVDGVQRPAGSSGFVTGGGGDEPAGGSANAAAQRPRTLVERVAPTATRVGLSLFVGVVVGTIFRAFVKVMVAITAVVVAAVMALSYFDVLNVDVSGARAQYDSAAAWLQAQGGHLKDALFARLPSAGAATAGFIFGFKRR